jgi:DNA-binding CsgD family transcriptional regulator
MNAAHVPRLRYRRAQRADIAECLPMLPEHIGLDAATRAALPALYARLVNEPSVFFMIMEDHALPPLARIQAWGLATALTSQSAARLQLDARPQPFLARRIYHAWLDGSLVPPDDAAFGRANANGDVLFVALHYAMRRNDLDDPTTQALLAVGNEGMRFGMAGFNLAAIHYENSVEADAWMAAAGFIARDAVGVHHGLRLWGMTRDEARRTMPGTTARHLFEWQPPRFALSVSQRRLLLQALFHEDDEQLARALDVSPHGLKKLWRGIYERIADTVPDFFGDTTTADDGKRGPEKRRQVLAYVRQRPEELRPWVTG